MSPVWTMAAAAGPLLWGSFALGKGIGTHFGIENLKHTSVYSRNLYGDPEPKNTPFRRLLNGVWATATTLAPFILTTAAFGPIAGPLLGGTVAGYVAAGVAGVITSLTSLISSGCAEEDETPYDHKKGATRILEIFKTDIFDRGNENDWSQHNGLATAASQAEINTPMHRKGFSDVTFELISEQLGVPSYNEVEAQRREANSYHSGNTSGMVTGLVIGLNID
jgi:hypothetical protein